MKTNEWLYGKGVKVAPIPKDVANDRIDKLNVHLHQLLDISYLKRDDHRVADVIDAIKYWKNLRDGKGI